MLHIPLLIGDHRYMITVQVDFEAANAETIYVATGSDFLNLQESNAGFGMTIESAVETLLKSYGMPRHQYKLVKDPMDEEGYIFAQAAANNT